MSSAEARLHRNARRAQEALEQAGLETMVRQLDGSARTVADAAATLGVLEGQIAKSLVFMAGDEAVLVVASGDERVDTGKLSEMHGERVTRANADQVRAATGYPIGGVSPAGLPDSLAVYVERSLARWEVVWAAAGTPHTVFPATFDELLRLTGGVPSDVGHAPS